MSLPSWSDCRRVVSVFSVVGLTGAIGLAAAAQEAPTLGFAFTNIAREAGLAAVTVFGGERANRYLLETTGTGAAALDYDGDGWLDIFLVNGSRLEGFAPGEAPTSHLYRNKRDGTFQDVTRTPPGPIPWRPRRRCA